MIFKDFAPLYWEANLPVMPLKAWDSPAKGAGKAPILNEWTQYGEHMPSKPMRDAWLATESYANCNIGLPFGSASGLCAIDIDTEDEDRINAILSVLPPSPWRRIGKKGMGLIYRWHGQPNFKLRDGDNQSIVEFLGKGNQMVLPPSIHPDTGKPYVANTNLWEVLDQVVGLPEDIERILRQALGNVPGLTLAASSRSMPLEVVPQGERDIQMIRHAGYLARVVLGIDKNAKFSLAEAMKHMVHWVENFTSRTSGDDLDPDKGVSKLVEFLLKDVEAGRTLPNGWDVGLTDEQKAHPAIAAMIEKNQTQRWTVSKANDWLRSQVAMDPENTDRTIELVEELIEKLAKDENFTVTSFNHVAETIKQVSGDSLKWSKPELRSAFNIARRGDTDSEGDHESIARRVMGEMSRGGEIRFDQGFFWQWNGSCFSKLDEDEIYTCIAESVKDNVLARRHNDYIAITKTMSKLARGSLVEELEDGINFANGFLDTNLQLHPHSPKYGKTFTMPFNYVPERADEAHKWFEYLERAWGDDEDYADKVMALQEAFAVTMFGIAPRYQRAFLLYGRAGTGKTQALEVLRALMPPAAQSSVPPSVWSERFQLQPMVGKTLNICGEMPEDSVIGGSVFKQVIEGTPQNTELKGGAIFEFRPTAAQWLAGNHLPKSKDSSNGFTRRWQIFDFNRVVPPEEKIVNFHHTLISEEREAIAAWAVKGLQRVMKRGDYTQPASHLQRLQQITRANNSVIAFLQSSDKVRPEAGATADLQHVFDHYVEHMKSMSRGFSVTFERFRQMIEEVHDVRPYEDGTGQFRHEVIGLHVRSAMMPNKR